MCTLETIKTVVDNRTHCYVLNKNAVSFIKMRWSKMFRIRVS